MKTQDLVEMGCICLEDGAWNAFVNLFHCDFFFSPRHFLLFVIIKSHGIFCSRYAKRQGWLYICEFLLFGREAWMGGSKNGIRAILRLSFNCNNDSVQPHSSPWHSPLRPNTHTKKGGRRKKHWQKKYENDKCIWPERAGTKLASSSTSLGHPQTYIYIGIYRRGREKN